MRRPKNLSTLMCGLRPDGPDLSTTILRRNEETDELLELHPVYLKGRIVENVPTDGDWFRMTHKFYGHTVLTPYISHWENESPHNEDYDDPDPEWFRGDVDAGWKPPIYHLGDETKGLRDHLGL